MATVELVLLQRVEKLGQMGEIVKVKPGYARNFLLPQKKALRASKANLARFEEQKAQLVALNLKRKEEAERLAERMGNMSVIIIRQAGESGSLYGSVSPRDISDAATAGGLTIARQQVAADHFHRGFLKGAGLSHQDANTFTPREQALHQMASDEAGGSGDQDHDWVLRNSTSPK